MNKKTFLIIGMTVFFGSVLIGTARAEDTATGTDVQQEAVAEVAKAEVAKAEVAPAPVEEAQAVLPSAEQAVNIAVDEKDAVKKEVSEILPNPAWDGYQPEVVVSKWGGEVKVVVNPAKEMKSDKLAAIQSVKLETVKGDFLGLKTYPADEKTRNAEFMVNPVVLQIEAVKVTVKSSLDGEYAAIVSLVLPAENRLPGEGIDTTEPIKAEVSKAVKQVEKKGSEGKDAAASKAETGKKKGWLW